MRTQGLLLASLLVLAACGDEPAPTADAFPVPAWAKVAPEQIAEARKHGVPVAFENDLGMRFVLIPAGTFLMGSPEDEEGRGDDETQREVKISKPFYMSIYEATNAEYRLLESDHVSGPRYSLGGPPQGYEFGGDTQPAAEINWVAAQEFSEFISDRDEIRTYRLPTEEEWEYACRAGTSSAYWWGSDVAGIEMYANGLSVTAPGAPASVMRDDGYAVSAPVGSFPPNPWGLYDMHGNVSEWSSSMERQGPTILPQEDTGTVAGSMRVARAYQRGGAWGGWPQNLRAAERTSWPTNSATCVMGFRLVSPLPEKAK